MKRNVWYDRGTILKEDYHMMKLTFGEQVKIILSRRGMTIKELAELVEKHTGKPMSRQNMTQRLGRDNFQEQDMRMIAEILGCQFTLSIMEPEVVVEPDGRDITVEELIPIEEQPIEEAVEEIVEEVVEEVKQPKTVTAWERQDEVDAPSRGVQGFFKKPSPSFGKENLGEMNPYTKREYESNSVRTHPSRIGYVQVYDQEFHRWTDMTEWAFLGFQERKKKLLGKDYKPPIYLD